MMKQKLDILEDVQENLIDTTVFPLSKELSFWQLGCHISNMCMTFGTEETLSGLMDAIDAPGNIQFMLEMRHTDSRMFRAAQIVVHYGATSVQEYILAIYC